MVNRYQRNLTEPQHGIASGVHVMDRRLRWLVVAGCLFSLICLHVGTGKGSGGRSLAQVATPVERNPDGGPQPVVRPAPARRQHVRSVERSSPPTQAKRSQHNKPWPRRPPVVARSKHVQTAPSEPATVATPQQRGLPAQRNFRHQQPVPTVRRAEAGEPGQGHQTGKEPVVGREMSTFSSAGGEPATEAESLLGEEPAAGEEATSTQEPTTTRESAATEQPAEPATPAEPGDPGGPADLGGPELGPPATGRVEEAAVDSPLSGKAAGDSSGQEAESSPRGKEAGEPEGGTPGVPEAPSSYPVTAEPLSAELITLRDRVRQVLQTHMQRKLNTRDHTSWEVMHRIVAYGTACEILRGGPQGTPVNAIGWLLYGGACKGQRLVVVEQGRLAAKQGVGVQGHPGQLLAIIAQARASADYPIVLEGRSYTLSDLIESEKLTCRSGTELTFKLIALSWYLDSDSTWRNTAGEEWSIARLVKEEIEAPILRTAACGGTHRLMGLTYAVREREREGKPIEGQFLRAKKYLEEYHSYTFKLQNGDGSFSTEWFVRRGARPDLNRRLQTTGHILEWLVYSLPESMLRDERVVRAVDYLSGILAAQPDRRWEIGPLGHALHALAIYDERVFVPHDSVPSSLGVQPLASKEQAAGQAHSRRKAGNQR